SANALREMLRKFKRWSAGSHGSALILAEACCGSPHVSKGRDDTAIGAVHTGADPRTKFRPTPQLKAILADADSVFALCPSTMSPEIRYIKLLKGMATEHTETREAPPAGTRASLPASTGTQAPSPASEDPAPSLSTVHCALYPDEVATYRLTRSHGY